MNSRKAVQHDQTAATAWSQATAVMMAPHSVGKEFSAFMCDINETNVPKSAACGYSHSCWRVRSCPRPSEREDRAPKKTSGPSFSVHICTILNSHLVSLCISRQQRHCNVLLLRVGRVRVGMGMVMVMVMRRVRGRGMRVGMRRVRGRGVRVGTVIVMRATATEAAALDALEDEHGHDRCDGAH